ncbi:MAG TPA: PEP-CTERM sorting domain-containing protein [Phycisphaerae bacterium]|nr:PEP-CTERM sorting domain-containing protein [Phycisphaerae bacterium]
MKICWILPAAVLAGAFATQRYAAATPLFTFTSPAGWSVGAPGSTYQEWAADGQADDIAGAPNVAFNDAGAGLPQPALTAATPGFVAGSGGFYSFSGPYTVTAAIHNATLAPPADAGTYVIVQTFATINSDDGEGHSGTVLDESITDSAGAAIPGAQHVRSTIYGYAENFPSSFGPVDVQATIDEYWLPNFTADFNATLDMIDDSSLQGVRVDSILASAGPGGAAPFAITPVPEPATLAALCSAGTLLLLRRRKHV